MKISNLLVSASVLTIILSSCAKKDDGPLGAGGCGYTWSVRLSDEAAELSQAASAYAQDTSQANCEAYKKAYLDYLDEAEDIKACVPASEKDDFQQGIDDARKELDDLPC